MTLDNLENVLVMQLRDLLNAEEQMIEALPRNGAGRLFGRT